MRSIAILTIAVAATFCLTVSATIINIPDDYPTIQQGIDACNPGDTVMVEPGTYYENVQMAEGVNLIGSGMTNTIIDGQGQNDVVKAVNINTFMIEGFTVQNSRQDGSSPGNIGIFMNPTSSVGAKTVRYCHVKDNGHGIDVWNDFGGITYVEHNIISDNIYDGFDPYLGTTYLTNNTIYGNGRDGYNDWSGGGVVFIRNNIINENGRYGIFKHRDTPVLISYNDVWNNVQGNYYEGYSGDPIPFTPSPGTGEISEDPLLVDPEFGDFYLTFGSPCIDAGDPESPDDPDGTIADMGAIFYDQIINIKEFSILPERFILSQNYPNPFNASTTIKYNLSEPAVVTISIFDLLGHKIETLIQAKQPAGEYQITWYAEHNPSGVYFYRIHAGDYTKAKKMILLK
ncbi:MAG: T9SS type A sorting domain-containing protein [candidate division Zixibacteria bacterium]|nr:T9SS type A sorting domain-containing protein [candidate division Zixibacteria bacterium]